MAPLRGVIRGKTIELDTEPGLPDGQQVLVSVRRLLPSGEGIRQSAGAWADAGESLDAWLEQVRRDLIRSQTAGKPAR